MTIELKMLTFTTHLFSALRFRNSGFSDAGVVLVDGGNYPAAGCALLILHCVYKVSGGF